MASDSPKPKGPPGWNDPPMFSYDTQVQAGMTSKLSLTKRVSFPLGAGTSSVPSPPINPSYGPPLAADGNSRLVGTSLPPIGISTPLKCSQLSCASALPSSGSTLTEKPINSEISLTDVTFEQIYKDLESEIENYKKDNERTATDIKKKILLLENMWNENKFDAQLKLRILELTKAIKEKDLKAGLELQRSLMVDHASLCSSWIPALRQLLNSIESKSTQS